MFTTTYELVLDSGDEGGLFHDFRKAWDAFRDRGEVGSRLVMWGEDEKPLSEMEMRASGIPEILY